MAQQAFHTAALVSSSSLSSAEDFKSLSPDYKFFSPASRPLSASLGVTTNGITCSTSNASISCSNISGAIAGFRVYDRRGNFGRRVLPVSSKLPRLPLLLFHVPPIAALPVYHQYRSSRGRVIAKFPALALKSFVNCRSKWHRIGILDSYSRSFQTRRGNRGGSGSGSSSDEANQKGGKILEELRQEVEETRGNQDHDRKRNGRIDRQGGSGQRGKRSEEDAVNPDEVIAQNNEAETGPWWRFWKQGETVEDDVSLGFQDKLLLQDLENLRFSWRDLLDPTWENALALGFTALLTVALSKILFQVVLVVITILASALKYTVLAALLVGVLIFLL